MKKYTAKIIVEPFNNMVNFYESDSEEMVRDLITPIQKSAENKVMRLTTFDTSGHRIDRYYVKNVAFTFVIEVITRADAL